MSRSALWRQEANVQERERQAQDAFLNAVEEGRVRCVHNTVIGGTCTTVAHHSNVNIPADMSTYYAVSCLGFQNNRAKGLVPLHGPDDSFNLSPMLLQAISKSGYFAMCCREIRDWSKLVDEIYNEVKHLEPWTIGTSTRPLLKRAMCEWTADLGFAR
jgi:hypothetical protein